MKNLLKLLFLKSYDEIMTEKTKEVVNDVFDINGIEFNIQTSMYELMQNIYIAMDDKYLQEIANTVKQKNPQLVNDILSVQKEALMDMLISKNMLTKQDIL